jgi:hypothetical protein
MAYNTEKWKRMIDTWKTTINAQPFYLSACKNKEILNDKSIILPALLKMLRNSDIEDCIISAHFRILHKGTDYERKIIVKAHFRQVKSASTKVLNRLNKLNVDWPELKVIKKYL